MSFSSELAAAIEDDDLKFGDHKSKMIVAKEKLSLLSNTGDVTTIQRMISACLGSFITSLVVTPFDVIRIRIQQQEILPANAPCCNVHFPDNTATRNTLLKNSNISSASTAATTTAKFPELFWLNGGYCKSGDHCTRINSTFQGFTSISRNEGLGTLWRGLSLTLFMAIPSNIIYFTGYEYARDHSPISSHPLNPLVCGSFARMMAATFVAPVELIKTRLQSIPTDMKSNSKNSNILGTLLKDSYSILRKRGLGTLFTGLQITLWRDVPFSGIYWSFYELFKSRIGEFLEADFDNPHQQGEDWKIFTTSFFSGSLAGIIAAFFTNPFDVGKTRLQITTQEAQSKGQNFKKPSMFQFLINIHQKEGMGALYSGFGPRVMKIAPSCAIMISSYEIGKKIFKNGNNANNTNRL